MVVLDEPEEGPGEPEMPQGTEEGEQADMEGDFLELLRSSWEIASTVQFCRMFADPLKLRPFSTDKLEAALLYPDEHSMFLAELLYKLLRRDTREPYTEREAFVWEDLLKRKLDAQWPQAFTAHPMAGRDFYTVDPLSRVNILYALCEWRLDECAAIREVIRQAADNPETADHLRHKPIGEDSKGNRYFHFADNSEDCRLYREEPPRKRPGKKNKDKSDEALWETVCTTLEDMSDFAAKMSASRNKNDKALHDLLTTSVLPKLMDTVQARRKAEERAAALEAMPKKRSSRIQVLQIKKDEEERNKKEEEEERMRLEKERERQRKDREREMRLKARQDEEERLQRQAAELRRKLAGIHPDGPSREERYYRRLQQIDDGEIPSRGSSESRGLSMSETSGSQPRQQPQQAAASEPEMEHSSPARKATPPVPTAKFHQPLDFPMPPMDMIGAEPSGFHAQEQQHQQPAPWQQHHNPYWQQREDLQQQQQQHELGNSGGRQLRNRGGQLGQNAVGRRREHSPGWSPMGLHVVKRRRMLRTRPKRNTSALARFGKPLPPPRLDDYYEGSDLDLSSDKDEEPAYKPRSRADRSRRRQKDTDSDPDYEGERSERSGRSAKARAAAKRSTASNSARPSAAAQHPSFMSQQMQAQRMQEQELQRRQLLARYQHASPAERQLIKQQLIAQQQRQQMMQQQQQEAQMAGMQPGAPYGAQAGMAAVDAQAKQAALRQQMQVQQRQEVLRLLSTLTPEQREQLSRLPPAAQNQFLGQLQQRHLEQQQQQVVAQEAARQHGMQQRMLASLTPQQMLQLQSMPKPQQQAALSSLTQRFQAQEQARLMQRQQAMQQMGQANGPLGQPTHQQQQQQMAQHGFASQGFQQKAQEAPGSSGAVYSQAAQQQQQQQQQRRRPQFMLPTQPMVPTGLPGMERGFQTQSSAGNGVAADWARRSGAHPAVQKAVAGFAPRPGPSMLEPLPVSFPQHSGGAGFGAPQQLQPVSAPMGSLPSASVPAQQQPRSPSFTAQGTSRPEARLPGPAGEVAGRVEQSVSPRYGAPVTTGHDKAHDGGDHAGAPISQVTSGAPQSNQPFQHAAGKFQQPQQTAAPAVQQAAWPLSAGQSPLVIITSAAPSTTVGLATPAPTNHPVQEGPPSGGDRELGAGAPEGNQGAQELSQQDGPAFPDEEQEGRCPSPLPVSLDEFGEASDLQDMMSGGLPWDSESAPQNDPSSEAAVKSSNVGPATDVSEPGMQALPAHHRNGDRSDGENKISP